MLLDMPTVRPHSVRTCGFLCVRATRGASIGGEELHGRSVRLSRGARGRAAARTAPGAPARILVLGVALVLIATACGGRRRGSGHGGRGASSPARRRPRRPGAGPRRRHPRLEPLRRGAEGGLPGDGRLLRRADRRHVTINTIDHNTFQDNINSYLQGTPDDIFTWFAGYRMRFFAAQGLVTPIDDVWATIGSNYSRRLQGGLDGRRRQAVLHPDLQLPVGRHLPQEPLRGEGLHRPHDLGRVHRPRRQDEGRRPRPARLRRQGRLAGDGHVRHPQHAPSTATSSTST